MIKVEMKHCSVKLSEHNLKEETLLNIAGGSAGICYRSEDSYEKNKQRVISCINKGHTSVLEHINISFEVLCDRGTSHALVRHRHCAFTQESTIYTNYEKQGMLYCIALPETDPYKLGYKFDESYNKNLYYMFQEAVKNYEYLLSKGLPAGIARDVLPNCTATILKITTNFRELQSILKIRKQPSDSVRMHQVIYLLEKELINNYPMLTSAILNKE